MVMLEIGDQLESSLAELNLVRKKNYLLYVLAINLRESPGWVRKTALLIFIVFYGRNFSRKEIVELLGK
jgi:hypothetical protein